MSSFSSVVPSESEWHGARSRRVVQVAMSTRLALSRSQWRGRSVKPDSRSFYLLSVARFWQINTACAVHSWMCARKPVGPRVYSIDRSRCVVSYRGSIIGQTFLNSTSHWQLERRANENARRTSEWLRRQKCAGWTTSVDAGKCVSSTANYNLHRVDSVPRRRRIDTFEQESLNKSIPWFSHCPVLFVEGDRSIGNCKDPII